MQSPGKSKQEEQWGCVRKDVQCPKGRPGLPEPGPGTFIPNTPLPFPAGEGETTRLTLRYPGMAVGAERCPHMDRAWVTVGWHKEHTAHGRWHKEHTAHGQVALSEPWHIAQWDGEQGTAWARGQAQNSRHGRIHCGSWAVLPHSSTMQSTLPRLPTAGSRPSVPAPRVAPVLAMACHRGHGAASGGACGGTPG